MDDTAGPWQARCGLCEVLVALFLARAMLPLGYLPAPDGRGGITLRLCSSALPGSGGPAAPGHDRSGPGDGDHGLCPHACGTARSREPEAAA